MPKEAGKMADVLLDALSEYVLFVDPQMRIRWANRVAVDSANLDLSNLNGRHCYEIWHNRREICPECPVAKVFETGQPQEGEITSPEKKRWSIRGYPIWDDQGKLLGAAEIALDITALRQAQESLGESEAKYSALVDKARDAIVIIQDGIIQFANRSIEMTGYTAEELQGKPFLDLLAPESKEAAIRRFLQRMEGAQLSPTFELKMLRKDGTTFDAEASSTVIQYRGKPAMLGFARDITKRKSVRETLRVESDKMQALLDGLARAGIGIDIIGVDYKIHFQNEALQEIFGDLVGKLCYEEYMGQNAPCAHCPMVDSIRSNKPESVELTGIDGKDYQVLSAPLPNPDGTVDKAIEIVLDITERKQVEEALRASEEFSSSLLNSAPNGIVVINPDTSVQYVNRALEKLTGYSAEEIVGRKSPYPWWTEETLQKTAEDLKDAMSGRVHRLEEFFKKKNGEEFWVEIFSVRVERDGEFKYYVSNWVDITERKRTEEALKESERRYKAQFDHALDAFFIADAESGTITDCNRAAQKLAGRARSELIGKHQRILHPPEELEGGFSRTYKQHLQEKEGLPLEAQVITKEGKKRDVSIKANIFEIKGKKVLQGIFRDITEQKRAEEERRKLHEQIQHAQKLESLGVLAGGIAHDFNNLLMGVLGNASLVLLDLPEGSPMRHSVEQIEKTARAAADLTNQMLAYSGKGRFVVEAVDLSRLVEEMAGLLTVSISKKVDLKFDFDRDLPPVEADATQLRQVVMNLIINASEAIGDKSGVVSVRTGTMEADSSFLTETYTHDNLPAGAYTYLEVSDTGCGMDKETIGRIFDPFFTTKFTGRGLGLAAALGIVRGHKGAVRVRSEPGQGATIRVVFPPYAGEGLAVATEPEREKTSKASGNVLVVDDEATIRDVSRRMLESCGFEVITAGNGREALEIFRKQADEIAAVLLDATMPQMDGLETFEELRRIRQDVRVVLSSGYSEQEATERFTDKGLTGFIQKPYRFDDLIDKMQEILGK